MFSDPETEGLLLLDASNAFNCLNCHLALINISSLCPAFSRILISTYRIGIELFLDNDSILSIEGTTQGDPLAMAMYMYAIATVPLINRLHPLAHQIWYADNAAACGSLAQLHVWWKSLLLLSGCCCEKVMLRGS